MRIVERIIFKQETSLQAKMLIDKDQHAYKEGTSRIDFLIDRKQRVVVDGLDRKYVDITRGVPHGSRSISVLLNGK